MRASASIPFFFEPVEIAGEHGKATLVDGGLVLNYPISIFDRLDEQPPRWPTIGIRLDALGIGTPGPVRPVGGPVSMGIAVVETAISASQAEHVLDPRNMARSVYVETSDVGAIDFGITEDEQDLLLAAGCRAGEEFLDTWDYPRWLAEG